MKFVIHLITLAFLALAACQSSAENLQSRSGDAGIPQAGRLAELDEACAALEKKDYARALVLFSLLAGQGNAEAQFNLGMMYAEELGVPQDDEEALKWVRLAAEQGYGEAQYRMGVMYANYGVMHDNEKAIKWARLAAEQGNDKAQYFLGVMYVYGRGVMQDFGEAAKWYRLAAEQGHAGARKALGMNKEDEMPGLVPGLPVP